MLHFLITFKTEKSQRPHDIKQIATATVKITIFSKQEHYNHIILKYSPKLLTTKG